MNKKGDTIIIDIFALILLALIIFLFFYLVNLQAQVKGVNYKLVDKSVKEVDTLLLNYLRTPIELDNEVLEGNLQISDLIVYLTNNKDDELEEFFINDLNAFFESCLPESKSVPVGINVMDIKHWKFEVYDSQEVLRINQGSCSNWKTAFRGIKIVAPEIVDPTSIVLIPDENSGFVKVVLTSCYGNLVEDNLC